MLRLLAAAGVTTVGGQMIVSSPAFADSGSVNCLYEFSGTPTLTTTVVNRTFSADTLQLSVANTAGTCPCSATSTIEYAYSITIPGVGSGSTGWVASSVVSVSSPATLWIASGSVTVRVGIRVTCTGPSGTTIRCRFGEATYSVGAPFFSQAFVLNLATNNGNGSPPTGIPACSPASAAPLAASRSAGPSLVLTPGLLGDTSPTDG